MSGSERRDQIIQILSEAKHPVSGKELAGHFAVSRQVIVQDIALLRAQEHEILSTSQGYLLSEVKKLCRVFKVVHSDTAVEEELNLIVDCGGHVEDVFVYHKVYGVVRAELPINSRNDIQEFMRDLKGGHSALLNFIQTRLQERGFLAELKDYEPVHFRKKETKEEP